MRRGEAIPRNIDTVVIRKDGRRLPIEVGTGQVEIDGTPAFVAFFRDGSERVEAQEALRRSEARFRRLIEAVPEAIGVAHDGKLVYVNPALVRMLGCERADELVGRAMREFVVPEEVPVLAERVRMVSSGAELAPHEYRVRRRDGSVITIEAYSIAVD